MNIYYVASALAAWIIFQTGHVLAAPSCSDQDVVRAAAAAAPSIPAEYMRPAMMAIGDSMFNGVTSATIDGLRADLSVPALVARGLEIRFQQATYPRALLFDLEEQLTYSTFAWVFRDSVVKNIKQWKVDYPAGGGHANSHPMFFDNVAVAQATSGQMICGTAAESNVLWRDVPVTTTGLGVSNIAKWYESINTSFLLNPRDLDGRSGQPDLRNLSQLTQVLLRKPHRLLVNVGSNDGVWQMAFNGIIPPQADLDQLVENMKMIARLIPNETKYVYVATLVPPSRVPNLEGVGKLDDTTCDNGALRYKDYRPYLSTGSTQAISGAKACEYDELIAATNARIQSEMREQFRKRSVTDHGASTIKLIFVDFDRLLREYDKKHDKNSKSLDIEWGTEKRELDNRVVHNRLGRREGGITGYDNMHPTMVMYARAAQEIIASILANETHDPVAHLRPKAPTYDLVQCVATELRVGNPGPPCPPRPNAQPMSTAVNMGPLEDLHLRLASGVLASFSSPNAMIDAAARVSDESGTRAVERAATGCMLSYALSVVGGRSFAAADPTAQETLKRNQEAFKRTCEEVIKQAGY